MAVPTAKQFKQLHPDFGGFDDEVIQTHLNEQANYCPDRTWTWSGEAVPGTTQVRGIRLRVAHILEMQRQQQAQAAGAAAAAAKGKPPSNPSAKGDDWDLTTYGRQYKQLRRSLPTSSGFAL